MSFKMDVKVEKVLEDGAYPAVLDSVEQIETKFGERLIWRFTVSAENVEVVGFTSMSPSTRAKAYQWAAAIAGGIDPPKASWGPEDVEGKPCTVVLEAAEDAQGVEKNRVVKVKPSRADAKPESSAETAEEHFESLLS